MIFTILLLVLATASAVPLGAERKWNNFKLAHNKVYDTLKEENYRFQVFLDNLRDIEEHNEKYEANITTWYKKINEFADMTTEEFLKAMSCSDLPEQLEVPEEDLSEPLGVLPSDIDYKEAFNPVRDQGNWGTCYAFTTTATIEAHRAINGYPRRILSPQNIVDCTKVSPYNNNGSWGGFRSTSMLYAQDYGIMLEKDYPYTGYENPCRHDARKVAVKISGYSFITNSEYSFQNTLNNDGPIAVAIDAKEWQCFGGGIFTPTQPFLNAGHAVVLAGYGTTSCTGYDYWLVRNSWGTRWGESGNIRVNRAVIGNKHIGLGVRGRVSGVIPLL